MSNPQVRVIPPVPPKREKKVVIYCRASGKSGTSRSDFARMMEDCKGQF